MLIYRYPDKSLWPKLVKRPELDTRVMEEKVRVIMEEVREDGDAAVKKYTAQFDGTAPEALQATAAEIDAAWGAIAPELFDAIKLAASNIRTFHERQWQDASPVETMPGVTCWRKNTPIEKVGLYIPGGTAPLFSTVLMLAIPAAIAGCKEIILCTPPARDGSIHPAILAAAKHTGVTRIFKVGGVQAIAAMAYGTASIPRVSKIFGPGNQYVTAAKQLAQKNGVAIDMPAGPSEVAVFADSTANPAFVAADLLSQAEHGADSQAILVTAYEPFIALLQDELARQLGALPRKEIAQKALSNSKIVLVNNDAEAMALLNEYAPEHLILSCANAEELAAQVINAGSVFLGHYSPESVGDYASGTNHTLPTNGHAKAYSGVSVDSFVKKITFQQLSAEGLKNIGGATATMADAEGLQGHAHAVRVRLNEINKR
ncbi:MAG: histidinol dehydrogenase [Chitinophagaceae bacterium]|nr:histidinol dehydrogenase [Chitinophagaceae bacterium]